MMMMMQGPRARSWPHRRRALCRLSRAYLIQGQLYYSLRATLRRKINRCAIVRPRRDGARGCYSRWHKIIVSFIPGNDLIAGRDGDIGTSITL